MIMALPLQWNACYLCYKIIDQLLLDKAVEKGYVEHFASPDSGQRAALTGEQIVNKDVESGDGQSPDNMLPV